MRTRQVGFILIGLVALLLAASCSKAPTPPAVPPKLDPETELTFAPVQYDTTTFRVHFYWNGFDEDGEVMEFHYAVDNDTLLPVPEWRSTVAKDTTLLFLVDPVKELKVHVFKVAAVDNEGRYDQTPASRAFSAKTIPPTSKIEKGPSAFNPTIGPNFTFEWSGIDPDGGETGGKAPVDSFQYMLLRVGATAGDPITHQPLPSVFTPKVYTDIINAGTGASLQPPYDDWVWQGIRGLKFRFRNVTPGPYVFVERAVDIAGATEKNLKFPGPQGPNSNIRQFTVTSHNAGPRLTVRSSILNRPLDSATGPEDFVRKQLQIFEGETVSFSWTATAVDYGGEIVGYTYALDDTSQFQGIDLRLLGATFQPSQLPPGPHFLYVRCVDDGGLVTNLVLPLLIVHPNFKDAGWPRGILFVDDSVPRLGNGSAPSDPTENNWWLTRSSASGDGPLYFDGLIPHTEWDTVEQSEGGVEGRKQPDARTLADYTTVVWATDAENGGSVATGFFKTIAGGDYSEVQGYLRAGGTLILTGWHIAADASGNRLLTLKDGTYSPNGICSAFTPGSVEFDQTIFPRMYMGIDNSLQSQAGLRTAGASDFTRANPTAAALALGFDTARVDTGNTATGVQYPDNSGSGQPTFKWNTATDPPPFNPNLQLFPGLAGIEGWIMARNFACKDIQDLDVEPGVPIARVLYTYHGARTGPLMDGGPSPREGLAVGAFYGSHDLGTHSGPYDPTAAIGRVAIYTFPLYYLKDDDAINIMRKSFEFVNASPTLP
jgi:hypothetical protein